MRIVAGEMRGRRLAAPRGDFTRPTTDKVREAVFNSLASLDVVVGATVADLYAGSGAMGFEALSRGAEHCTFVEKHRGAVVAIDDNIAALGVLGRSTVIVGDAIATAPRLDVDLVFADPPYGDDDWPRLLRAVRADLVVAEADQRGAGPAGLGAGPGQALRADLGDVPPPRRPPAGRRRVTVPAALRWRAPMATVLYPGSFDPIHLGHLDVVEQGVELFGHVTVAVMHNREKSSGLFPVDERLELIRASAAGAGIGDRVDVVAHSGLAIDAAATVGAGVHRQGTAQRGGLRDRAADGADEPLRDRRAHRLPAVSRRSGFHQQPLRARDRQVPWSGHPHGAPARRRRAGRALPERCGRPMSYDDDDNYDDEYDEYDEIDDEYPEPGQGYVGDAETLLRRSIDIIATAPTMPLSSSPRIDRDEIIELLEEALQRLPDELRQARWMLKERQEFVAKTRREADELLEAARVRAERMVQRTEVVRAAEQRARQVMETAEADSRRLRHETEDFLDQRLGSFEILLDKLQKTVGAGRQRLSIGALPMQEGDDVEEDDPTKGFFDQDR